MLNLQTLTTQTVPLDIAGMACVTLIISVSHQHAYVLSIRQETGVKESQEGEHSPNQIHTTIIRNGA
ncbi:hypothetical protein EB796_016802 [Bugula neritina]|uniref:Uncharacterized protein n=1 Tax=Bugula neritina TaxID=10212 RepID=A0A7J7JEZ3_BUGNE|nr:hypothetical protein EB796_016802 [Bugula neritina]